MNAIKTLFSAVANVAASLNSLAAVIDIATGRLRQQLALEAPEVIEHHADTSTEDSASTKPTRKGK